MLDLIDEPRDQTYRDLLRLAIHHCSSFSLTWRDRINFSELANRVRSSLQPSLIREVYTDEWPGTKLSGGHQAMVRHYQFTEDTLEILSRTPSLYAWLSPSLPEDLALYKSDDICWLLSIAHEKDAAILDEAITVDDLLKTVPGIKVKRRQ